MTATATLLSLSETARELNVPTSRLVRAVHRGQVAPDFASGATLLFKRERLPSLAKTLAAVTRTVGRPSFSPQTTAAN